MINTPINSSRSIFSLGELLAQSSAYLELAVELGLEFRGSFKAAEDLKRTKALFGPPSGPEPQALNLKPKSYEFLTPKDKGKSNNIYLDINPTRTQAQKIVGTASLQTKERILKLNNEETRALNSLNWLKEVTDLEGLNQSLRSCRACPLARQGVIKIPGRGAAGAKIMFVIEPPSEFGLEAEQNPGGAEGELLDKIISSGLKLSSHEYYITSVVKCLSSNNGKINHNELKSCAQIVLREIQLISPKLVLTMGLFSGQALSDRFSPLTLIKQRPYLVFGTIPLRLTYSLTDLVAMPELKMDLWNDLKRYRAEGLIG
ncbi:MAG: uracil-DNA glycosylase [Deltaproteobacteria bacterium]|jgi:DNA polymerase|nr:uracil-DNA glycosylase [Deltaproteobacteria bacterium]